MSNISYDLCLAVRGQNLRELKKFKKAVSTRGTRFSLGKLMPVPDSLPDNLFWESHPRSERTKWKKKHWGIERDIYTRQANFLPENTKDLYLWYDTDSHGGVPIKWLKAVSPMFPSLLFAITYKEDYVYEGKKYWEGYAKITNGQITKKYVKRVIKIPTNYSSDFFDDYDDDKNGKEWYEEIKDRAYFVSEDELIPKR